MSAALTLVEERTLVPVEAFELQETAGQHNLVTVTLRERPSFDLQSGTPVNVRQIAEMEDLDFNGYIDTAVPYNSGDGHRGGVYYLLAASSVLRSGTTRTWDNRTPFEIAKDIVEPHGFGLEMDKFGGTVGHFAQTTQSDWEALRNLANDIGFVLYADNTVVRIVDPTIVIRRAEGQNLTPLAVTENSKFVMEESLTPVGYESYEFTGIDRWGVSFKVEVNRDSPVKKLIREEVESLADALAAAERVRNRSAAQLRATMMTDYHPSIRVGTALAVDEGSRVRHWFVLGATHRYSGKAGVKSGTTLTLCRTPVRATSAISPRHLQRPISILANGKWRSAHSWTVEL